MILSHMINLRVFYFWRYRQERQQIPIFSFLIRAAERSHRLARRHVYLHNQINSD